MINELTFIDTIVVPQGAEYQAVCRGLQQAKVNVRVVSIPIGMNNIEEIINNSLRSSSYIAIAGLCGSLSKQYSIGDVVLYRDCWNLQGDCVYSDEKLNLKIQQKLGVNLVSGLSCDRIIHRVTEKLNLSKTYPAEVVDMEGYGYINKLQQRQIPVTMLRVVSDDLTGNISDLSQAVDNQGNLKTIDMAIAFLQQPIAAIRLIKGSLKALKILQQVTYQLTENAE